MYIVGCTRSAYFTIALVFRGIRAAPPIASVAVSMEDPYWQVHSPLHATKSVLSSSRIAVVVAVVNAWLRGSHSSSRSLNGTGGSISARSTVFVTIRFVNFPTNRIRNRRSILVVLKPVQLRARAVGFADVVR